MPKLQHGEFLEHVNRRDARVVELLAAIGARNAACKLLLRIIRKEKSQDVRCALLVGKARHLFDEVHSDHRHFIGHEKSSVHCQSLDDRLCGRDA